MCGSLAAGTASASLDTTLRAWEDTAWIPPDDVRYARAVGRLRVKEKELLSARRLRTIAETADLDAAVADLEDTVYGPALAGLTHPEDFEEALVQELKRAYELLNELCLEPQIEQWLRLRHDVANVKALLKGGATLPLSPVGNVPTEVLREALEAGDYRNVPPAVGCLAAGAAAASQQEGLLPMELWLDREAYAAQAELLVGRRNPFLGELLRIKVDLANLASLVRFNRLERSRADAPLYIAPGGSFGLRFWLRLSGMPLEEIQEAFFMTEYHGLVAQGLDRLSETGSFAILEKLSEEHFMEHLREAKYSVFGVEPLVAFALAKEHEIAMLRMILVGKQNRIASQFLVDRISTCYV
jgi:V/A-type H+-transporting ATPase subunit C